MKIFCNTIFGIFAFFCTTCLAQEKYASYFSVDLTFGDHMVLQREAPIWITGSGTPNTKIHVSLAGNGDSFQVDENGRWKAVLPAMEAGGPYSLVVNGSRESTPVTITDIMVGEVWLCSGQSNMQWPLIDTIACDRIGGDCDGYQAVAESASLPIRFFDAASNAKFSPGVLQSQPRGTWQVANSGNVSPFSATAWYFGRQLAKDMPGVTIGLISACYGGTKICAWLGETAFKTGNCQKELAKIATVGMTPAALDAYNDNQKKIFLEEQRKWMADFSTCQPEASAVASNYKDANYDDGTWATVETGYNAFPAGQEGIMWFRKTVVVPPAWRGVPLTLHLGAVDDCDWTYVNGRLVGSTLIDTDKYWEVLREYQIPKDAVGEDGRLTIAVRMANLFGDGGLQNNGQDMYVTTADGNGNARIDIGRDWKCRVEFFADVANLGNRPVLDLVTSQSFEDRNFPGTLYNAMINPWLNFRLRGILWYQGESNTGAANEYARYQDLLIADWRRAFQNPDLAFILCQAAGYRRSAAENRGDENAWKSDPAGMSFFAPLREAQYQSYLRQDPSITGMAVAIDIADQYDPHPRRKAPVGYRLAKIAQRLCYGKDIVCSGPEMVKVDLDGDTYIVHFKNVGGGLVADKNEYGQVGGFIVADENHIFHHAEAEIVGDTVKVRCEGVPRPTALRYGWVNYSEALNLYNREGFPALPFRTDLPHIYKK